MALNELGGKVAAVTGAASGLGRAMALALASEGMHVALADVDEGGLAATRERAGAHGVRTVAMRVDVSSASDVDAFAARTVRELNGIHVVCNNAGVAVSGAAWENSEAEWQWLLGVNLWGVIHGVRAFAPRLIARTPCPSTPWLRCPNRCITTCASAARVSAYRFCARPTCRPGSQTRTRTGSRLKNRRNAWQRKTRSARRSLPASSPRTMWRAPSSRR
jgi:NAD(P)-dependent dehydrogenase (short-subunit alcohol dehydrogenase family)